MTANPPTIGTGARAIPLADAVSKLSPMTVRLEARDTMASVIGPLLYGEAEFASVTGVSMYDAINGIIQGLEKLQPRRVWNGFPYIAAACTRGDSGIKSLADLKGKKVPQTPASASFSKNIQAYLAFANLTLNDVVVVTVPTITASHDGLVLGTVDISNGTPFGAQFVELAAGRHGITWFNAPPKDVEGWKRLRAIMPAGNPVQMKEAAGLKPGEIVDAFGYEESIWSTPNVSDDIVYEFNKALKAGYDTYSVQNKDLKAWTWERAFSLEGILNLPYHNGTVKFMKDNGVWTAEHEKFQQAALAAEKTRLGK